MLFQSTRPLRGATENSLFILLLHYFNPRAPCGARRKTVALDSPSQYFNPRAPCGARRATPSGTASGQSDFNPRAPCGARQPQFREVKLDLEFQSTRPLRGATQILCPVSPPRSISIHAPLAGRDWVCRCWWCWGRKRFQSTRPLRGATEKYLKNHREEAKFQSTRPLRGATKLSTSNFSIIRISIHAPLAGRDGIQPVA